MPGKARDGKAVVRRHARRHAVMHARTHACRHARMHARTHAGMQSCTQSRTHACTHTRMHARTHARTHVCTHSRMHAHIHACMHAHIHACMHAHEHACMHAWLHTVTQARTCPCMLMRPHASGSRVRDPVLARHLPRGHPAAAVPLHARRAGGGSPGLHQKRDVAGAGGAEPGGGGAEVSGCVPALLVCSGCWARRTLRCSVHERTWPRSQHGRCQGVGSGAAAAAAVASAVAAAAAQAGPACSAWLVLEPPLPSQCRGGAAYGGWVAQVRACPSQERKGALCGAQEMRGVMRGAACLHHHRSPPSNCAGLAGIDAAVVRKARLLGPCVGVFAGAFGSFVGVGGGVVVSVRELPLLM